MVMVTWTGLVLATGTSVVNVLTDVCRKKSVEKNDVIGTWFWISSIAAAVFGFAFLCHILIAPGPILHPSGAIFGYLWGGFGANWPPIYKLLFFLFLDGGLETAGLYFYLRALQLSDLSISVPFLAFTPVLLIPTGYIVLHEIPNFRQDLGVLLVVAGSIAMNMRAFRQDFWGPFRAILTEPGSKYMLLVSVCFALTNPMDKVVVLMTDPITAGFGYGITVWIFYAILMVVRGKQWWSALRVSPRWIVLSGILYASTQLLQFMSHRLIDVVLTITIKRAGILLSVLAGWLIFREKHIQDRLTASAIMLVGAILIYLPVSGRLQVLLVFLVAIFLAIHLRRGALLPVRSRP